MKTEDLSTEVTRIITQSENDHVEYKAVLPPARTIALHISAFANSNGGYLILGIREDAAGIHVKGLSEDFRATAITQKAIELLSPIPNVSYDHVVIEEKRLFAIKVEPSFGIVLFEGKSYIRQHAHSIVQSPHARGIMPSEYERVQTLFDQFDNYKRHCTSAMTKFIEHYQGVLNIVNDLKKLLYPNSPATVTSNEEGRILMRILFSSCADNFETYLSDLLYEIYLANPATLKSGQEVTLKEVLDCGDMQEFVVYVAKKKLSKLQRGSVKGFIKENRQIDELDVINQTEQDEIEKVLQIRHLYAHRNGIVDDKFLHYYPTGYRLNEQHNLSMEQTLDKISFFAEIVRRLDTSAMNKYSLASLS